MPGLGAEPCCANGLSWDSFWNREKEPTKNGPEGVQNRLQTVWLSSVRKVAMAKGAAGQSALEPDG